MSLEEQIIKLREQVEAMKANSREEVESLRLRFLSKKGEIGRLYDAFREIPKEHKAQIGASLNLLKSQCEERLQQMRNKYAVSTVNSGFDMDLTRTPDPIQLGSRHPINIVRERIVDIFSRVGFVIADGPEIEDDRHVFGLLNFADEHPARDMQDTFYIKKEKNTVSSDDILLRTHTSSVQTRIMLGQQPPIRILCPGRVYRNEAISARAHCFFHQIEGLYIDKNVSFADLREVLLYFAKEMFGTTTEIRLRPSYFPFTEPSAEMDITCHICDGKGCSFCKNTGWVEILGCGMVDPNVLRLCNINPDIYSGYAFGLGIERITNLKYRVKDLRMFSENDIRFLHQFVSA